MVLCGAHSVRNYCLHHDENADMSLGPNHKLPVCSMLMRQNGLTGNLPRLGGADIRWTDLFW